MGDFASIYAPMLTVDDLLRLIGPFTEARDISNARLSKLLFNDGKRLKAMIERNGDIGSRCLRDAFQWLADNWPEGAEWPSDVPRPAPAKVAA